MDALFDVGGEAFFPGLEEAIDRHGVPEGDRPRLPPAVLPGDHGRTPRRDRRLALRGRPDRGGQEHRPDGAEPGDARGPGPPPPGPLGRGRPLRPRTAPPSTGAASTCRSSCGSWPIPDGPRRGPDGPGRLRPRSSKLIAAGPPDSADEPPEVRRALPDVLARIGTQQRRRHPVEELGPPRAKTWSRPLVDALYKLRAERPAGPVPREGRPARGPPLILRACDLVLDPPGSTRTRPGPLLDIRIKRVFDLLTLVYPREDIVNDYQNILQGTAKSVDYSLEHLDNLLDREVKDLLFPLSRTCRPSERAGA